MLNFARFLSLAGLTQIVLLLNLLVLLPIQLSSWGQAETAQWYSVLALSSIVTLADLGLRTAGHVQISTMRVSGLSLPDAAMLEQIWRSMKASVFLVTLLVILCNLIISGSNGFVAQAYWGSMLVMGLAFETLLMIRITYLDSAGLYSRAEISYLCFIAGRFLASIVGIAVFNFTAGGVSVVYVTSALIALLLQDGNLPERTRYPGAQRLAANRFHKGPLCDCAKHDLSAVLDVVANEFARLGAVALGDAGRGNRLRCVARLVRFWLGRPTFRSGALPRLSMSQHARLGEAPVRKQHSLCC